MFEILFGSGHFFLLDMIPGPQHWLWDTWLQKAILCTVFLLPWLGMFTLARRFSAVPYAMVSGALYALNPYVYERMLAGQYLVLAGYGLFPLLILTLLHALERRTIKSLLLFSVTHALLAFLSPHWWYIGVFFCMLLIAAHFMLKRFRLTIKHFFAVAAIVIIPFLALNFTWLSAHSSVFSVLGKIGMADFAAFATLPDSRHGVWLNVLNLYGFWQDDALLPKDVFRWWFIVGPILLMLASVGIMKRIRQRDALAITCAIAFPVALLVVVGYGSNLTRPLIDILATWLPGFTGLRETAKAAGVLAFIYALWAPASFQQSAISNQQRESEKKQHTLYPIRHTLYAPLLLILLALVSSYGLLGNFQGQVRASKYPSSWSELSITLRHDEATAMLFLPWQGYLRFPWSQNRLINNPAAVFFPQPVFSSRRGNWTYRIASDESVYDDVVYRLIQGLSTLRDELPALRAGDVSHIVLARAGDWQRYAGFLDPSSCQPVFDADDIMACRLLAISDQ